MRKITNLTFLSILIIYVGLSIGVAVTQPPNEDNMQHVSIVNTFLKHGYLGCSILSSNGERRFYKYDKYVYGVPQASHMLLVIWSKIFGVGLFQFRSFNIFFGLISLIGWLLVFRELGVKDKKILSLTLLVMSIHPLYIGNSVHRPFEPIINTLLPLGLYSYLYWRELSLNKAIFISQMLAALSCAVHPNGLLVCLEVTALMFYMDRKNLTLVHAFCFVLPYIIIGTPILIYIFKDFEVFKMQLLGNLEPINTPSLRFWNRIYSMLYSDFYIAHGIQMFPRNPMFFLLLLQGVSLIVILVKLRQEFFVRFILALLIGHYIFFTFITSHYCTYYVYYFIPLFSIATAIAYNYFMEKGGVVRGFFSCSIFLSIIISIYSPYTPLWVIVKDEYHKDYLPEVKSMQRLLREGDSIFAPRELGFGLGVDNILDDNSLGYFSKQERNIFIVLKNWENSPLKGKDLPAYLFMKNKMKNSLLIYNGKAYDMYRFAKT